MERKTGVGMQILAGVKAEQDIAQRCLQLARGNVDLVALVYGLQRRREPLAQETALIQNVRIAARAHEERGVPHRAAVLGGACLARQPDFLRALSSDQSTNQLVYELGLNTPRPLIQAANQRALV